MSSLLFVGLDLGSNHCYQTVINADGKFVSERSIPTSEFHLRSAFATLGKQAFVHFEASELAPWVYSIISPLVAQVVVSHPRSMAWIGKDSLKDDAIDARKLADLLRLNQTHPVYYENLESRRHFKHLVTHYEQLAHDQARLKAKIKARLRTLGIIRQDSHLFAKSGQIQLLDSIKQPALKIMMTQSFAVLNQMLETQGAARVSMIEFSRQFAEVRLLQTAPGVGIITACKFVGYLQTPKRFSNKRQLWRYCRLGITRRESNGKRLSYPRLDRSGVGSLKDVSRKVFEAALRTKKDNLFKRFYEQSLTETKNKVHARLSTQRKILATLRAMWIKMMPFEDSSGS
jgi:transposase